MNLFWIIGLIFTGVAFASSRAQSLLQNNAAASETKVPEVQRIEDVQQSTPTPAPAARVSIPDSSPTQSPKPSAKPTPAATPTPKPNANLTTITGLRQSRSSLDDDKDDTESSETEKVDGSGSAINNAFQRAKGND